MSASTPNADAMEISPPTVQPTLSQQTYRQIAASHISALNKLNSNLPDILALIAAALSQLTNNPIQSEARADSPRARDDDIRAFSAAIKSVMQGFREALVEQINDLERYKVIPATMPKFTPLPGRPQGMGPGALQQLQQQGPARLDPDAGVKNGGYGQFDVGWLNAQVAGKTVGGDDALDRVRAVLDELLERSGEGSAQKPEAEEMAVDG